MLQNHTKPQTTTLKSLLSEPLFHFAILAAFIFFIHNLVGGGEKKDIIVVDAATQKFLFDQEQEVLLRDLAEEEKKDIIGSFVEDELLVREAKKRGFSDNSRVRSLLIQNMRFFLRDDLPVPSEKELREYYNAQIETFITPASIIYDQVFFRHSDVVPETFLNELRSGSYSNKNNKITLGPSSNFEAKKQTIIESFGPKEAKKVLRISDNQWHGPFYSSLGVHFLRVKKRKMSVIPRFEDVKDWVSMHWNMNKHRESLDKKIEEIKQNYTIKIETIGAGRTNE